MPNPYFRFKQFTVYHDRCAMKVTTDSCLFGAWAAEKIQETEIKIQNILDIGAGSGLLSLMVAQKNEAQIDSVEIDEEAALQAAENVRMSPWEEKVTVHHNDILLFRSDKQYDAIISNPPFYENELSTASTIKNLAHHSEALLISQVIQIIAQHLRENGRFFLLYPYKRQEEIKMLFDQTGLYPIQSVIVKQSVKHAPFRIMTIGTNIKTEESKPIELSVWDELQRYTPEFERLLRDYYLYL